MKEHIELPDTLWELCLVVHEDLAACRADSRYIVDMNYWHMPHRGGTCVVCAAGAIIAQRGGVEVTMYVSANAFDADTKRKLLAVDDLRSGMVSSAVRELRGDAAPNKRVYATHPTRPCGYADNPDAFMQWLLDLSAWAKELEL